MLRNVCKCLSRLSYIGGLRLCVKLVLVLGLSVSSVWAEEPDQSARLWLVNMSNALKEFSYQGVFVHWSKDGLAAMHVMHVVDELGEHEYLTTLTGPERRVVRDSSGFDRLKVKGAAESSLSHELERIEKFYKLTLLEKARVAGRVAQLLEVRPLDEFRYGYRLWLDEGTALLLKSNLMDLDGTVLEQVMFTSMDIDHAGELKPPTTLLPEKKHGQSNLVTQDSAWLVSDVPPGFEMVSTHYSDEGRVEHMTYTDGLASVSVFIEKLVEETPSFVGVSRMGVVSAYGARLEGYQVTVVGEVPESTVRLMGTSIRSRMGVQP